MSIKEKENSVETVENFGKDDDTGSRSFDELLLKIV